MKNKINFTGYLSVTVAFVVLLVGFTASARQSVKVGVAGLTHNHIYGILNDYKNGKVNIVGIAEPSKPLQEKYRKQFNLPDSLFYSDLKTMVKARKPDIVLGYNAVANHVDIVEVCAPLHIQVMVEKPLAATLAQAKRMEALANQYQITVLTNYETTWHPALQDAYNIINKDSIGAIRKMVIHDGQQGPIEIGCSPEFLAWLTDPVLNGAGALNDFGCYGADLMTWLMHGQKPIAVTAVARHYKPEKYPKVEDDATVIVEYPTATGIIEASWAWPYGIKDMEVFGETGYLHAVDRDNLVMQLRDKKQTVQKVNPLISPEDNPISYFTAFLNKMISADDDRSSLKYNMIVMQILDAAKRSIKEGKRIVL
ncbi:hypothetical protein BH09BAC6_BH09BAC6_24720 [soil metagenome]|jgi:predicted dehydrogenase